MSCSVALPMILLIELDWMATKPQESCLHLPSVGITGAYCCAWLFLWVQGILTQVLITPLIKPSSLPLGEHFYLHPMY